MLSSKKALYIIFILALMVSVLLVWGFPKSKIAMLTIPVLALFQFFHVGYFYTKKLGRRVWAALVLSFLLCIFKVFDGIFLDTYNRFFVDTLLYLSVGYMLLKWKSFSWSFETVFFLIFSTPILIFTSAFIFADKFFIPLILCVPFSLLLLYFVQKSAKPIAYIVISVLIIGCMSYLLYPNYLQALSGKEMNTNDQRATLSITNAKNDTITVNSAGEKVVVLDVWYSGCGVCVQKFPILEKLADKYRNNPNVIIGALNIPLEEELQDRKAFDLVNKYRFNSFKATSAINQNVWGIEAYPTVLIFDKQHRLRYSGQIEIDKRVLVNNTAGLIDKLLAE